MSIKEGFVNKTLDGFTEEEKILLEDHFVKQRNKKLAVKTLKFSAVVGTSLAIVVGLVGVAKKLTND